MTADESDIHWGETPRPVEWIPPWQRAAGVPEAESVTSFKVASDPRPMLGSRSDADLIVVGRASDPRVETLGGTTEWLLHHPPSPMVIVGQPDPARRVTVCADGSEHATSACETFAGLPLASDADVVVIAVADGRSDAEQSAADAGAILEGRVASVTTQILTGTPTKAIIGYLDSEKPDLVVLGTKGLTGWKRIRLGSTAGAVARSAHCNVMVGSSEL